jgi:hypothetical protein
MKRFSVLLITLVLFFTACHKDKSLYVPQPETKVNPEPVIILRYDSALFSVDPNNLREGIGQLAGKYYFFLGPDWSDTINLMNLQQFITDPNIRKLYNIEKQKYADLSSLKTGLSDVIARYRSYFPDKPQPEVYTYISGLNIEMPVLFTDSAMAIGLDMFLGNDQVIYREGGIPEYKIARMTHTYLLPECMKAVAGSLTVADNDDQTILNQMINAGKVLYFLDAMFPGMADHIKIGYTQEQLAWCQANEENIWKFLIGNQLLFNTEPAAASKLIADGPFTSGFAQESPGRIGVWVGWQIVRAYASNNRKLSLKQIMETTGAQKILEASEYKPGR